MYIVCWNVEGFKGQGRPISERDALEWMKVGNKAHGYGTHWVIRA